MLRWAFASLLWSFSLLFAAVAGFLFYMEGRWAIWCGDNVCEGNIPYAIVATLLSLLAISLGWWVVRPSRRAPKTTRATRAT